MTREEIPQPPEPVEVGVRLIEAWPERWWYGADGELVCYERYRNRLTAEHEALWGDYGGSR